MATADYDTLLRNELRRQKREERRARWRLAWVEIKSHWPRQRIVLLNVVSGMLVFSSIASHLVSRHDSATYELLLAIYIKAAAIRYGSR